MAKRGQELNTRITATDEASKIVDDVAKKVGRLEDDEHVADIDADGSQAESEIRNVDRRLEGLTGEDHIAVLQAQGKQAQREVDNLTRKLANAHKYDDDEIRLFVEARDLATKKLEGIRQELADLQDEAADTGESLKDRLSGAFSSLDSKFGGIGGKLGAKLGAGFAAVGVGALMVDALNKSWEKAGGIRQITGQFRLSRDEAARYGKEAGELYADNWGDSAAEVQRVVATAGERLEDTTKESLGAISEQILAVSKTWDKDYQSVIRSVTQLTQNGLAKSSQDALDLIVTGFQDGADEAGDFLETIDEYSQHWAAANLSGKDAMNQLIHGIQNGQRDVDKIADAVKEMRLRIVENSVPVRDALQSIGLDADEITGAFIKGGPAARTAFLDVVGALKAGQDAGGDTADAVAIIGTQFEDLGPKALDSLLAVEGQLRDTEGAAKDLADQVGEVSPWQDAKREGESFIGKIGDGLALQVGPALSGVNRGLEGLSDGFGLFGDEAEEQSSRTTEAMDLIAESIADATRERDIANERARQSADAAEVAAEALRDEARANEHTTTTLVEAKRANENAAAAAEEHAEKVDQLYSSTMRLVGGDIAVRDAQRQAAEAMANLAENATAQSAEVDSATESQLRAAEAAANYRIEQAEASGETLTAKERSAIHREELQKLADKLDGPVRDALLGYIGDLDAIPKSVDTWVNTNYRDVYHSEVNRDAARAANNAAKEALPAFDQGGIVPGPVGSPQMIKAHGGETILPTHKKGDMSGGPLVNIENATFESKTDVEAFAQRLRMLGV